MGPAIARRAALALAAGCALPRLAHAQAAEGLEAGEARITTAGGDVAGFFTKPAGPGPFPLVLVAEDGTGLGRFVADACRDLAKAGLFAVAPALFGGNPPDGTLLQRLDSAADWAAQHGGDKARLGIVGFGPGGRLAWLFDAYSPAVKAAVAWGGAMQEPTSPARPMTALAAASHLHGPLLGLVGKNDGIPQRVLLDAEAAAKEAGKLAEIVVYVGARGNFAAVGQPSYDEPAAFDGWIRTLAWFKAHQVA